MSTDLSLTALDPDTIDLGGSFITDSHHAAHLAEVYPSARIVDPGPGVALPHQTTVHLSAKDLADFNAKAACARVAQ